MIFRNKERKTGSGWPLPLRGNGATRPGFLQLGGVHDPNRNLVPAALLALD
jgi:hypothetical protein